MNGFLSSPFAQGRGLRQGDTISPILFNFALEPFLLSVLHHDNIGGYTLASKPRSASLCLPPPPPVKLLAYADDVLVFINDTAELDHLQTCLTRYG